MTINAQTWLKDYLTYLKQDNTNITEIKGNKIPTETDIPLTPSIPYERLTGDLLIEDYSQLKTLDLTSVNELDKLIIGNCPNLKEIKLQNSGVKEIVFTSQLEKLTFLDFSFEVSPAHDRNEVRKVVELDLTNTPNLKTLKCFGVHDTNLIGTEHLTQLREFHGGKNFVFPTDSILSQKLQAANKQLNSLQTQLESQTNKGYWDNIPTPIKWLGAISIIFIAYAWLKNRIKGQ